MKEEMHEAECGSWLGGRACGHKQHFITKDLAEEHLRNHLKSYHGADTSKPSTEYYGWVRPYPPPTWRPRGRRRDDLSV